MNEDVITDLKQFIATTISQQTVELSTRIDSVENRLDRVEQRLKKKIDDLTDFVTNAIDVSNEEHGKQLKNHERRITKLEHAR
jgi:gas vesicle protein